MVDHTEQEGRARARIGSTVRDKYRIDALLGMGGMAVVYAATHRNQAEFAIKMLHPELSLSTDLKTRFLREGYAANSVKHPGVVLVVDDDVAEDGAAFLVMERLRGAGVEALLEKNRGVPVSEAMGIVDQLLDVLGAAHEKNIIHRDIKPANLFLTRDGTVKVLDFGIARVRDGLATAGGATATGALLGTPAFMAPEQALAKTNEIDGRTDLWAAGATLFTLITGAFVHEGDNAPQLLVNASTREARSLSSLVPNAPRAVVDFLARALAFEKIDRFPTAAAMQTALRDAHQIAFGEPPPRGSLAALTQGSSGSAEVSPPRVSGTQATEAAPARPEEPARVVSELASTTHHPVATEAPKANKRSTAPRLIAVASGMLLLLGGAFAISQVGLSHHGPSTAASSPIVAAGDSIPAPPSVTTPLTATAQASTSSSAPLVTTAPVVIARPPTVSSAKPKPTASAKPNCNPDFYYDKDGLKHFKEECL